MADAESSQSLREAAHMRVPFSAWLGVILLFLVFGVIVLAIIGPSPRGTDYEQNRRKKRADTFTKSHEEDVKSLTGYAWVDKTKGTARIPIDRAMELTVAQLSQQK